MESGKTWREEVEEAADRLWSTWETGELDGPELERMRERIRELHARTREAECLWLLSEIEIYRSRAARRAAAEIAKAGLSAAPELKTLHDNYVFGLGGIWSDFHKVNHHRLIAAYERKVAERPDLWIARRILIEHLIDDYRFDEASAQIEQVRPHVGEQAYLLDFYAGEILYRTGRQEEAVAGWKRTCERYAEHPVCFYLLGESCAKFARYVEAVSAYERFFASQTAPRKIDALQALVDLYEILDNREALLHTLERILSVYAEDYGVTEGSEIEVYVRRRASDG